MLRLLLFLAAFSLAGLALLEPLERRMVYPFDPTRISPAAAGESRLREVQFPSDNETLILWVAAPRPGKPVILYFHGNAGNLANRAHRFTRFLDRGYGLVAPAYRGSSGSTGTPAESALRLDARAVYTALLELLNLPERPAVVLYGESLGTAVTIALNSMVGTDPAKGTVAPAAIVLEAPFTALEDVAKSAYPALAPLTAMMTNPWNSLASAPAIMAPLLVLHGDRDSLIPIEQGRRIFTAAPARSKQFLAVKGAGHTDIWRSDTLPVLWQFIDSHSRTAR